MTVDYVAKKQQSIVREVVRDHFKDKGIDIDALVENRKKYLDMIKAGFTTGLSTGPAANGTLGLSSAAALPYNRRDGICILLRPPGQGRPGLFPPDLQGLPGLRREGFDRRRP